MHGSRTTTKQYVGEYDVIKLLSATLQLFCRYSRSAHTRTNQKICFMVALFSRKYFSIAFITIRMYFHVIICKRMTLHWKVTKLNSIKIGRCSVNLITLWSLLTVYGNKNKLHVSFVIRVNETRKMEIERDRKRERERKLEISFIVAQSEYPKWLNI